MNKLPNYSGYVLALAASAFWLGWFLMPDAGTADTAHVLNITRHARTSVFYSTLTQVIATVLYLIALFLLVNHNGSQKKITLIGIILFGIGVMGMCADAFFHLFTYYLTDETILIDDNTVRVLSLIQTDGILVLMPLLILFLVGSLLLAIGLNSEGVISKIPMFLILTALLIIPLSVAILNTFYLVDGNLISLSILGLVATSHAFIGSELIISIQDQQEIDVCASPVRVTTGDQSRKQIY